MYKTYQEAFDQTIDKLVTQGNFGYDYEDEVCLYETQEGNRCAVGINLSDDTMKHLVHNLDTPLIEVWYLVSGDLEITEVPANDQEFWSTIQGLHDSYALGMSDSPPELILLEKWFGVVTTKANQLYDLTKSKKKTDQLNENHQKHPRRCYY